MAITPRVRLEPQAADELIVKGADRRETRRRYGDDRR